MPTDAVHKPMRLLTQCENRQFLVLANGSETVSRLMHRIDDLMMRLYDEHVVVERLSCDGYDLLPSALVSQLLQDLSVITAVVKDEHVLEHEEKQHPLKKNKTDKSNKSTEVSETQDVESEDPVKPKRTTRKNSSESSARSSDSNRKSKNAEESLDSSRKGTVVISEKSKESSKSDSNRKSKKSVEESSTNSASTSSSKTSTRSATAPVATSEPAESFDCPHCERVVRTSRGLKMHMMYFHSNE